MECEGLTNQKCKHGLSCVNHDSDPTTPRLCLARGQEGDICAGGVLQPFEGLLFLGWVYFYSCVSFYHHKFTQRMPRGASLRAGLCRQHHI